MDSVFGESSREVAEARLNSFLAKYLEHSFGSEENDPPDTKEKNVGDSITKDELLEVMKANNEALSKSILDSVNSRLDQEKKEREEQRQKDLAAQAREKEIREISSLCSKAGCEDKVEGFLQEELSVAEVRKQILDEMLKDGGNMKTGKGAGNLEGDAVYVKEYHDLSMSDTGFSVDEYVAYRREEDGLPVKQAD